MAVSVRVNRNQKLRRWTVQSLANGRLLGTAEGLLLRNARFVREGPSGWADGELVSWLDLQLSRWATEMPAAELVPPILGTWWSLKFRDGEFYLKGLVGPPLERCGWLRILRSHAEVFDPIEQS